MKTLEEIKQILNQNKNFLQENYRVTALEIFGSYARGEQTETSDIDVLIDYVDAPRRSREANSEPNSRSVS